MKKDDGAYRVTPLGRMGKEVYEKTIRQMVAIGVNAIVLENGRLEWASVEKVKPLPPIEEERK